VPIAIADCGLKEPSNAEFIDCGWKQESNQYQSAIGNQKSAMSSIGNP